MTRVKDKDRLIVFICYGAFLLLLQVRPQMKARVSENEAQSFCCFNSTLQTGAASLLVLCDANLPLTGTDAFFSDLNKNI